MGNFFSDVEPSRPQPYLNNYSACGSPQDILKQIELLSARRAKVENLQTQCIELQVSIVEHNGDEATDDGVSDPEPHKGLAESIEQLRVEILRLRHLRIQAEARAVLSGELDACDAPIKKGGNRAA